MTRDLLSMRLYRLFAVTYFLIMASLTLSCAENVSTTTNENLATSAEKQQPLEDSINHNHAITRMSVRDRFRVTRLSS